MLCYYAKKSSDIYVITRSLLQLRKNASEMDYHFDFIN